MSDINTWHSLSERKINNLNKVLNKISFLINEENERNIDDINNYFKKYDNFSSRNSDFVSKVKNFANKKGTSQYELLMRELHKKEIKDNFKFAIDYLVSLYKEGQDVTPELFTLLTSSNFIKLIISQAKQYIPGITQIDPEDLKDIVSDAIYEKLVNSLNSYNMNSGSPTFVSWLYSPNSAIMNAIKKSVKSKSKTDSMDASINNDDDDAPKKGDFLGTSDEKVELDDDEKKILEDKIQKQKEFINSFISKKKEHLAYVFRKIYLLDELEALKNGEDIDSFDKKSTGRYGQWMNLFTNLDELEKGKTDLGSYLKKKALDIIVKPIMSEYLDTTFIDSIFEGGAKRIEGIKNEENFAKLLSTAIEKKPDIVNIIKYIGGTEDNSYFNNNLYNVFGPKYKDFVYKTLVEMQSMTRHTYKQALAKFGMKWEDLMLKGQIGKYQKSGKYSKEREQEPVNIDESENILKEEDSYIAAWLNS